MVTYGSLIFEGAFRNPRATFSYRSGGKPQSPKGALIFEGAFRNPRPVHRPEGSADREHDAGTVHGDAVKLLYRHQRNDAEPGAGLLDTFGGERGRGPGGVPALPVRSEP